MNPYQTCFKISISRLPEACGAMNGKWELLKSRVVKILTPEWSEHAFVIVEIEGDYPFITNQWEKFIHQVEE